MNRSQMEIAKMYKEAGKSRRRDSIFRPYQGDYLDCLAGNSVTEINELKSENSFSFLSDHLSSSYPSCSFCRDAIFRIIDHYDVNENIVFADGQCMQLCSNNTAPLRSAIGHHSRTTTIPIPGAIAGLIQPRLIVLTNAALYIMERTLSEQGANPDGLLQPPMKSLPWYDLPLSVSLS
jgi:hypothetical protein